MLQLAGRALPTGDHLGDSSPACRLLVQKKISALKRTGGSQPRGNEVGHATSVGLLVKIPTRLRGAMTLISPKFGPNSHVDESGSIERWAVE